MATISSGVLTKGGATARHSPLKRTSRPSSSARSNTRTAFSPGWPLIGRQFNGRCQAEVSDIGHVRFTLERMHGFFEDRREFRGSLDQALLGEYVQSRVGSGHGERVRRIGITVEELDGVRRARS